MANANAKYEAFIDCKGIWVEDKVSLNRENKEKYLQSEAYVDQCFRIGPSESLKEVKEKEDDEGKTSLLSDGLVVACVSDTHSEYQ